MSTSPDWISDVLGRFQLRQNVTGDFPIFHRYRLMVERSHLIERINGTCNAVNSLAGEALVYIEMFFQPHQLACRYVFEKDRIECRMSLAILPKGPTLIFSTFKANRWAEWINRCFGNSWDEEREHVVCEILINPATVSDAQLEQWFTYLLSGLRSSFKPLITIPRAKI